MGAPDLLARVERDLDGASAADLHSLCVGGLTMGRPALTHAAWSGARRRGAMLHRFLLARAALLVAAASSTCDRAWPCLSPARLAGRARDMDAVREASSALDALALSPSCLRGRRAHRSRAEPPTPEEIARCVRTERAAARCPFRPQTRAQAAGPEAAAGPV